MQVAAHYGITKRQLLDKEAGDLAVRMALGEAQVIAQTKAALAEAGVAVERLEAAAAASGRASASKASRRDRCGRGGPALQHAPLPPLPCRPFCLPTLRLPLAHFLPLRP